MKLHDHAQSWVDTEVFHHLLNLSFRNHVDANESLKTHRDFVENHVYGFGERAFWWLWKLIMDELPKEPKLLEIGVFKGATLSLWQLLNEKSWCYGVSPMDGEGLDWKEDYDAYVKFIHEKFNQNQPVIILGQSENEYVIKEALGYSLYDCVYVDGGHERRHIDNDMEQYAPMVKQGGYLVVDDCCNDLKMPFGYFQGIDDVTAGVNAYMSAHQSEWQFVLSVVHIKVFKKS